MSQSLSISLALATSALLLASISQSVNAYDYPVARVSNGVHRRDNYAGFDDPRANGGIMLSVSAFVWEISVLSHAQVLFSSGQIANGTYPAGLGEPLNAILSAESDGRVLELNSDKGGFLNYMLSTSLGEECFGQNYGSTQYTNLGDGQGNATELEVLRWNYGDVYIGTCRETFNGGLHLRYWRQNTTVSEELDLSSNHLIAPNGYNLGRDHFVGNLTNQTTVIPTRNVTNTSTYVGSTTWANYTYQTSVKYLSGLLQNSSDGINHPEIAVDGLPAIDGLVAVLTVKMTGVPPHSGALTNLVAPASTFLAVLLVATALLV
ncbi:hypothetical protein QFC21_005265 [Naganishia friedmannii]|uniref:Uncharacterized protein n=1 Tax=Naganishia friedmannii TaxID=89922 RepID=A0ACC2VAT1_9TREE|nr:hypothetical protein QFC21_005265 [Naganishia friedmannii]